MTRGVLLSALSILCAALFVAVAVPSCAAPPSPPEITEPREVHLADLVQLTHGGENAEAYWSPDGSELIFQSLRPPFACDQIFRMKADGPVSRQSEQSKQPEPVRVSNGRGRTTCSYFLRGGERVVYSSTHGSGPECPPVPDRSQGYVWPIYDSYEIWSAKPDGSDPRRLTDNRAYDAETTVCPKDGSLLFTSTRDGDLDLYRMDPDGGNVRRLTVIPGYDGGAFFSPDCSRIVWRASRPAPGPELEDYRGLLARGLVRPGKLEIWVADADGGNARQVTHLDAASFAPSFFPDGRRIAFSSNTGDPKGREFDLWAVDLDGSHLERITWTPGFDGFPLFSPDGTRLAFSSNRNQGAPGETNVFVARWVARPAAAEDPAAAARYAADVRWLADDAREGRGLGTAGLEEAGRWFAERFREIGVAPAGERGGWFQEFEVPTGAEVEPGTRLALDGRALDPAAFRPLGFSAEGSAAGEVVAAGHGIVAPDLKIDDYQGIDAAGKIVLVRRFTPSGGPFADPATESRYGDLRYKAWTARDHGASALLVVDLPEADSGQPKADPGPSEAELPLLQVSTAGDAGIPVLAVSRDAAAALFAGSHRAELTVDLAIRTDPARNVIGVVRAGAGDRRLPGAVVVGAHYDHLGRGGSSSLAPSSREVHNGADDNASGAAALLEAARRLVARRGELSRDVYLVAFAAEEVGTVGSSLFVRHPPDGPEIAELAGMINMDMVGRLRDDRLSVLGGDSAAEWQELVPAACRAAHLECTLGGEGFGPSDHSPFYAAGVPVLHLFTGLHEDYHKPSDDADKIEAAGGARVAGLAADLAAALANRNARLTYRRPAAPEPTTGGDVRAGGASLGVVPDYAGDGRKGVLLADVRPNGPAATAGLQRGDLLVELAGSPIRDIYDLTYALRKAHPGEQATAVVERGGERRSLEVIFGAPYRAR